MGLVSSIYTNGVPAKKKRKGKKQDTFSKKLNAKSTEHELKFRKILQSLRIPFEQNKPLLVREGFHRYPDFYIAAFKLIVEIDGGYHNNPDQIVKDRIREEELLKLRPGFKIIRIHNDDLDTSYETIKETMRELSLQYRLFYNNLHEYACAQFEGGHIHVKV
jgi:very-short-patch-repair endonuclease